MKKIYVILLVAMMGFSAQQASAIGISIKIEFGKHNAEGNCGPGRGVCSITIGGSLSMATPTDPNIQVVEGTAELKDGKLYVSIPKGINEKGKSERGTYSVVIQKNMTVDTGVAKQLGVGSLVISPGNYELKGNTFVFNVVAPRDVATGQATGKR